MNRIEFMTELAALLQDVPAIERQDAMKFYNDYFDDAGAENEQEVIREFESPAKLAKMIKANLGMEGEGVKSDKEEKSESQKNMGSQTFNRQGAEARPQDMNQEPPKTSPLLKVLLIIAIIIVGGPVIIPVALAAVAVVFAVIVAVVAMLASIILMFVALTVAGIVLFCAGIATLVPEIAVGLALIGTGLILGVLGVIGTVGSVKLCIVAVPGICRGIAAVFNRIFRRKAVA